jgi:4-amino-4-deoxy-L-arabinose transferase-like glycosyltransferase
VTIGKKQIWLIVSALILVQVLQTAYVVHRESLTFDEGDHMYAGYMMLHAGDYGLNPEHPPLVKMLATLPLLGEKLWLPPLHQREFKAEAYLNGRDWLAHNDGDSQRLVFRMRLAAGLLAIGLSLMVLVAAREWFGTVAGLAALTLVCFDPNVVGHSALVTTDIGVSLFFLTSIYAFYRYVKQPSLLRLALAGLASGLLLATKHSGILLAPMLILLIGWEIATAAKGTRGRLALRLLGAFGAIVVMGVVVLWAFYGFRYAARPAGLAMSTPLADYAAPLSHFNSTAVMVIAHLRLLPESYLIGLVDVKRMAEFYPTFIFGKNYAHGIWWYFPAVILIKTTLGLLALVATAVFAIFSRRLRKGRELAFILIPAAFYLLVAIQAGIDIGARHILPVDTFLFILAAGGIVALAAGSRRWAYLGAGLVLAHIVSALTVFPNYIAYANEAWGGPRNVHTLLSDANADWAQQLYQVKAWQDRHPAEECWFAYFARPEIDPAVYGIRCHAMPTADTGWLGGSDIVPQVINGYVLISAGDWSGCEWPSGRMNPYAIFQPLKTEEIIDNGVMVYHGSFQVNQAAALSRAMNAYALLERGKAVEALALAREAVSIDPGEIISQTALGDISALMGQKDEARKAWQAAIESARRLEPDAQVSYIPDLEGKLKKL